MMDRLTLPLEHTAVKWWEAPPTILDHRNRDVREWADFGIDYISHSVFVALETEVVEWCDENLSARPAFVKSEFLRSDGDFPWSLWLESPKLLLTLTFEDAEDAVHFKLRWY